ncbi:large conductance mechanosensitive channel protein MscL [Crocinitomicaceae bacterium]|nr:large conductance mechanosensitive channel protein MscL [Crocinitomicaceae bacterium]MDC0257497.1 large conductance mechanosensitive channel protein MscL [Crocinitomicaceae bacterium]
MFKEFKEFISRGNVIDLAVAVILAGAFGLIVKSLVNDIIMPVIGSFIGESFASLSKNINGVDVMYGLFIQAIVNFLIIAFVIFLIVRSINKMKKKKEEEPAAPAGPTMDQELLTEIRDLLKK